MPSSSPLRFKRQGLPLPLLPIVSRQLLLLGLVSVLSIRYHLPCHAFLLQHPLPPMISNGGYKNVISRAKKPRPDNFVSRTASLIDNNNDNNVSFTRFQSLLLHAKKGKNSSTKRKTSSSTSSSSPSTASSIGFGGEAVKPCPCGFSTRLNYMKCCGGIHRSMEEYSRATAEQVVRARYSAYAKREIDFIIASTHPQNKNFMEDIKHWKKTIEANCYDNFQLTKCRILSESYDGQGANESATVKFIATMKQIDTGAKTSFMETSTFERGDKGQWLYKDGVIETPPAE